MNVIERQRTVCTTCGRSLLFDPEHAGVISKCPKCGGMVQLHAASEEAKGAHDAHPSEMDLSGNQRCTMHQSKTPDLKLDHDDPVSAPTVSSSLARRLGRMFRSVPAIAAAALFLATLQRPPGFAVTVNYVALAVLLWCLAAFVLGSKRLTSTASRPVLATAIVVACVAYGRYLDGYDSHWTEAHASGEAMVSSSYVDTYRRGGEKPVYRWLRQNMSWPDGRSSSLVSEGPMAGEGKPHGKWELHNRKTGAPTEVSFFWYGEEISEGEWHLRKHE